MRRQIESKCLCGASIFMLKESQIKTKSRDTKRSPFSLHSLRMQRFHEQTKYTHLAFASLLSKTTFFLFIALLLSRSLSPSSLSLSLSHSLSPLSLHCIAMLFKYLYLYRFMSFKCHITHFQHSLTADFQPKFQLAKEREQQAINTKSTRKHSSHCINNFVNCSNEIP